MRRLYSLLLYLSLPLALAYLAYRGLRDRGYLRRWPERFGFFRPPPRRGGIVVHAVSMGEVNAASALVRELSRRYPDEALYFTTFTPTGSQRVRVLYGEDVFHVYAPLDLPGAVRRFFDRLQPRLLLVLETEIWPNLYHQAAARGIPVAIANARISTRSAGRYRRIRGLVAGALADVSAIAAQTTSDAERLEELGAPASRVHVTGNLKFDVRLAPGLREQAEAIRLAWGANRLALVAGSTHEGDEQVLLDAFRAVLASHPDALLVLVPRHPERFGRAAQLARAARLRVALRSEGIACPPQTQCFVIDAMGELMNYYAACDVAFLGGTFEPVGGHNPIEPAALGRPLLLGPHTGNVPDLAAQLEHCGAALRVTDAGALAASLGRLFDDADLRDRMGRAGRALVRESQGAVLHTADLVGRALTRATG